METIKEIRPAREPRQDLQPTIVTKQVKTVDLVKYPNLLVDISTRKWLGMQCRRIEVAQIRTW